MAHEIPTYEPKRLRAGDTWRWIKTLSDYPAPNYSLTYVLHLANGGNGSITVNTSANSSSHEVNVSNTTTANYAAGEYRVAGFVSDGVNRYTLDELDGLTVQILGDIETSNALDERSTAEKILANLETAATSLATGTIVSASENGKSYTRATMGELQRDIGYWRNVVWAERTRKAIRQGRQNPNLIRARFTTVS